MWLIEAAGAASINSSGASTSRPRQLNPQPIKLLPVNIFLPTLYRYGHLVSPAGNPAGRWGADPG
jgi:hypothetical protein